MVAPACKQAIVASAEEYVLLIACISSASVTIMPEYFHSSRRRSCMIMRDSEAGRPDASSAGMAR